MLALTPASISASIMLWRLEAAVLTSAMSLVHRSNMLYLLIVTNSMFSPVFLSFWLRQELNTCICIYVYHCASLSVCLACSRSSSCSIISLTYQTSSILCHFVRTLNNIHLVRLRVTHHELTSLPPRRVTGALGAVGRTSFVPSGRIFLQNLRL